MKRSVHLVLVMLLLISASVSAIQVRPAKAVGTIRILSDGSVYPPGAPISTSDKITYTLTADITDSIIIERNNIIFDGAAHTVMGDGSGYGLKLTGVSNVAVKNTNIQNFESGIYIESATAAVIAMNNITLNSNDGIKLLYVSNTAITGNRITWNGYDGVEMYSSSQNNITGNSIVSNSYFGIEVYDSSNIGISVNRIADNYEGIGLSYTSSSSVIHNDFINHTLQVYAVETVAAWDNGYPSGGNYWSDYTGVDLKSGPNQDQSGSDGIGDAPYNCSGNNQDRYPLMQTFANIAVQRVVPSKTVVGQGYNLSIQVQVENQGWEAQTTDVTIYVNTEIISTFANLAMPGRSQLILSSTWQTGTYTKGNYTISIVATPVPGEVDTTDDSYIWTVHLGVPGDVSSTVPGVYDGKVDMKDIAYLVSLFNTKPSSLNWQPNADVNNDGVCNMKDIATAIAYFNKHE